MHTHKNHNRTEREKANGGNGLGGALKRSREAFEGKYRQEIKDLLGLSEIEIQAAGFGIDRDVHEVLISLIMDASRLYITQDELKGRIEALGEDTVRIAKLIPSLARLF